MDLAIAIPQRDFGTRAEARTREIERCLKLDPAWILMLDSDQTVPIAGIMKFFSEAFSGSPHYSPTDETDIDVFVIDAPNRGKDDSNVYYLNGELSHFTISCCFIRPSVFEKLPRPWFRSDIAYTYEIEGLKPVEKSKDDNIGEDIYFSKKLLHNNCKIRVLGGVKSKHYQL